MTSPSTHRLTTASGVGYSATRYALQLLAADLGFSLLPMCAEPDKGVEGEQLDDVERLADLQRAIRRNAPQKVRAKLLGALIIDLMETETAVQHEGRKGECRS